MKRIITMLLLTTGIITYSCAQDTTCNRTLIIHSFEKRIPKDICFPEGYALWLILSDTVDIDGDGRVDFAGRFEKINMQDGDTTLVVLYRQNEMGAYEEWKTFNNLFPIYLYSYRYDHDLEHDRNDTSFFMDLRRRYTYPELTEVFFEKSTIISKFNTGGGGCFCILLTRKK